MGLQLEGVVERRTGQGRAATGGKRFRRRIHALKKIGSKAQVRL